MQEILDIGAYLLEQENRTAYMGINVIFTLSFLKIIKHRATKAFACPEVLLDQTLSTFAAFCLDLSSALYRNQEWNINTEHGMAILREDSVDSFHAKRETFVCTCALQFTFMFNLVIHYIFQQF